eukprot:Pgem_evm1s5898
MSDESQFNYSKFKFDEHNPNSGQFVATHQVSLETLSEDEHTFSVPDYQRLYCWDRNKIKTFIKDIKMSVYLNQNKSEKDKTPYSLGTICLCLKLNRDNNTHKFDIVDGQQRLTSITLILKYCYDYIKKHKKAWPINQNLMSRIEKIIYRKNNNNIWLENDKMDLNNYDVLNRTVTSDWLENTKEVQDLLASNLELIENELDLQNKKLDETASFLDYLCTKTILIALFVKEEDAITVFNTNRTGIDLHVTDYIRARFYYCLQNNRRKEMNDGGKIAADNWKILYKRYDTTKKMENFLVKSFQVVKFLEFCKKEDKIALEDIKDSVNKDLSNDNSPQHRYFFDLKKNSLKEASNMIKTLYMISELKKYIDDHKNFDVSTSRAINGLRFWSETSDLWDLWEVTVLAWLYDKQDISKGFVRPQEKDVKDFQKLVSTIQLYILNSVCKSKKYKERIVKDMKTMYDGMQPSNLDAHRDLIEILSTKDFYKENNKNINMATKFIFWRLEQDYYLSKDLKGVIPYGSDSILDSISIEHFFSKKPNFDITIYDDEISKKKHKLGNLTIVTRSENSRLRNHPPAQKLKQLQEDQTNFRVNKLLERMPSNPTNYNDWVDLHVIYIEKICKAFEIKKIEVDNQEISVFEEQHKKLSEKFKEYVEEKIKKSNDCNEDDGPNSDPPKLCDEPMYGSSKGEEEIFCKEEITANKCSRCHYYVDKRRCNKTANQEEKFCDSHFYVKDFPDIPDKDLENFHRHIFETLNKPEQKEYCYKFFEKLKYENLNKPNSKLSCKLSKEYQRNFLMVAHEWINKINEETVIKLISGWNGNVNDRNTRYCIDNLIGDRYNEDWKYCMSVNIFLRYLNEIQIETIEPDLQRPAAQQQQQTQPASQQQQQTPTASQQQQQQPTAPHFDESGGESPYNYRSHSICSSSDDSGYDEEGSHKLKRSREDSGNSDSGNPDSKKRKTEKNKLKMKKNKLKGKSKEEKGTSESQANLVKLFILALKYYKEKTGSQEKWKENNLILCRKKKIIKIWGNLNEFCETSDNTPNRVDYKQFNICNVKKAFDSIEVEIDSSVRRCYSLNLKVENKFDEYDRKVTELY